MKALTVQQPWAWAIVHGGKDVENRTQAWSYRGPLAIHAGARLSHRGVGSPLIRPPDVTGRPQLTNLEDGWGLWWRRGEERWGVRLTRGAIFGVVDLVDAHVAQMDCCKSPWGESPQERLGKLVHLVLEHPRPLIEPVPCRGALGLWTVPVDVVIQVVNQFGEASGELL